MEINNITSQYWTSLDIDALKSAQNFKDLYKIAHIIFNRMPDGIGQVCGPIATGGLGSVETNLKKFDETIKKLQSEGKIIFDQIPFEWPMQDLKKTVLEGRDSILNDFYLPIFESGKVKTLYFIKGWESSHGATWEHEQAQKIGIDIIYLN